MKKKVRLSVFTLSLVIIGCTQLSTQVGEMKFPGGTVLFPKEIFKKETPGVSLQTSSNSTIWLLTIKLNVL